MIVLAVDTGFEKTGFAIFKNNTYVNSAFILTKKAKKIEDRIKIIFNKLNEVISKSKPDIIVLEKLFFFKNQKTFIQVAQAQGATLLLAAQKNIPVKFITPLQIKQIVTGYGQADKKAVQKMLKLELDLDLKQDDEADAVAAAYAYCQLVRSNSF